MNTPSTATLLVVAALAAISLGACSKPAAATANTTENVASDNTMTADNTMTNTAQ
jgi:hypothetical protein